MDSPGGMTGGTERRDRLLILYGEAAQVTTLLQTLASDTCDIVSCPLPACGERWVEEFGPDLLLLSPPSDEDRLLQACESVREQTERPVVVLSERREESLVARALATGVDEYLCLPMGSRELTARIEAILRRTGRREVSSGVRQVGDLVLRPDESCVQLNGKRISLSPTELRLLSCLTASPGRVLTHDALMARVWGAEYVDSRHYLRLYIRYLREKLEPTPGDPRMIISEWGIGYRFEPPRGRTRPRS